MRSLSNQLKKLNASEGVRDSMIKRSDILSDFQQENKNDAKFRELEQQVSILEILVLKLFPLYITGERS